MPYRLPPPPSPVPRWVLCTLLVSTVLVSWSVALAAQACERMPLLSPETGVTVANATPAIEWVGDPSGHYRVQMALITPEIGPGQVIDLQVQGTRLVWPWAGVRRRTSVKLLVSRDCSGDSWAELNAQGPAFVIDPEPICTLDHRSIHQSPQGLGWSPVTGASGYRLRRMPPDGFRWGRPQPTGVEVRMEAPRWKPDPPLATDEMLVIEPWCDGIPGPAVVWP